MILTEQQVDVLKWIVSRHGGPIEFTQAQDGCLYLARGLDLRVVEPCGNVRRYDIEREARAA